MNKDIDNEIAIFQDHEWLSKFSEAYDCYLTMENAIEDKYSSLDMRYMEDEEEMKKLENISEINTKQMFVVFCTFTEVLIKEFLFTIFSQKQSLIGDFLPEKCQEKYNRTLKKECVQQEVIDSFAKIAVDTTFSFKKDKTINKIKRITKQNFKEEEKLKKELWVIFHLRNFIIHEDSYEIDKLKKNIAYLYKSLAPLLVKDLGRLCQNMGIKCTTVIEKEKKREFYELLSTLKL